MFDIWLPAFGVKVWPRFIRLLTIIFRSDLCRPVDTGRRLDRYRIVDKAGAYTTKAFMRDGLFWLILLSAGGLWADGLSISASPTDSSDGSTRLSWSVPEGGRVHIQRGSSADFSAPLSLYQGTDSASVITGLTDGRYFFRGRIQFSGGHSSSWSEPVAVTVEHHALHRTLVFFLLGAVVFLATLLLIVIGARRSRTMV